MRALAWVSRRVEGEGGGGAGAAGWVGGGEVVRPLGQRVLQSRLIRAVHLLLQVPKCMTFLLEDRNEAVREMLLLQAAQQVCTPLSNTLEELLRKVCTLLALPSAKGQILTQTSCCASRRSCASAWGLTRHRSSFLSREASSSRWGQRCQLAYQRSL